MLRPGELLAMVPPERELKGPVGSGLGRLPSLPLQSRPPLMGPSLPPLPGPFPLPAPPLCSQGPAPASPTPVKESLGTDGGPPAAGVRAPRLVGASVNGGISGQRRSAQLPRDSSEAETAHVWSGKVTPSDGRRRKSSQQAPSNNIVTATQSLTACLQEEASPSASTASPDSIPASTCAPWPRPARSTAGRHSKT